MEKPIVYLEVLNMTWFNTLRKAPYIDWKTVQAPYDSDVKSLGTMENPLVFIENPSPLPQEEWGSDYKKYYKGAYGTSEGKTYIYDENDEVSSFGRVRVNGKIVMPEHKPPYGFGTFLTGQLTHYKQNRYKSKYGGKTQTYGKPRGSLIPYKITVRFALENNIPIPNNAPIFASGTKIGTFKDWADKNNSKEVVKSEGFYFSPVFIEKIDAKKKKKLKKLLQKAQPTNMMGEDMTQLSDIIEELKEMDLVKSDKKLSKTVEGFDEKNLEILASASELRKDYETLFTQLRKMVYPDNKKKDGK